MVDTRWFAQEMDRLLDQPTKFLCFLESMGSTMIPSLAEAFEHFAIPHKEDRLQQVSDAYVHMMLDPTVTQEIKNSRTQSLGLFFQHYLFRDSIILDNIYHDLRHYKLDLTLVFPLLSLTDARRSYAKDAAVMINRRLNDAPLMFWLYIASQEAVMGVAALAFGQYDIPDKAGRLWLAFNSFSAILASPSLKEEEKKPLVTNAFLFMTQFMKYHVNHLSHLRQQLSKVTTISIVPCEEPLEA